MGRRESKHETSLFRKSAIHLSKLLSTEWSSHGETFLAEVVAAAHYLSQTLSRARRLKPREFAEANPRSPLRARARFPVKSIMYH